MSRRGAQGVLAFGVRDARAAGDFHVAASNRAAAAWIDRWPDWPAAGLVLHGPPGCGKTHLLSIWARRSRARPAAMHDLAGLVPAALAGDLRALAIDDVGDGLDERSLFLVYNALAERRGSLLLAAASPPARWPVAMPDLRSRIVALPAVAIDAPDDALLAAVLVKLFADRQTIVGAATIDYLVTRIERSFAAARRVVALLDRAACREQRAITVPFVREHLFANDQQDRTGGE